MSNPCGFSGLSESLPWMNEPPARLVIMPDDPALGEYREDLAGRLGTFGEFPSAANGSHGGYLGATEILSSRDLWLKWMEAPINIDVELFLRYRIFDLWIGNWDRHSKQWRWAYSPTTDNWRPIAEDMDQVMADYRGTMLKMARWYFPKVLTLKDEISHIEGAGANGADIDRWLLVGLGYETFMETARSLQAELTDEVIESGLRQMPPEWYSVNGEQLALRMMSSLGRIDSHSLRTGKLDDHDWPRLISSVNMLSKAKLFIDDTAALTPTDLRARTRRLKREHGLDLVIVDYLQLMQVGGSTENRATEISEISRSLKALAKELEVPIVALSQLNRSVEQRPDKRPVMSDLRESGSIEQDADLILFIYRDEVYNAESADKGTAEIIIRKQRNGPIGTVRLSFLGQYTRFENLAHDDYGGQFE